MFIARRASHVVSLLDPGMEPPAFDGLDPGRHLVLRFHDIDGPEPGYAHPGRDDIRVLVDFARALPPDGRLLIHCVAGVSRSPAAGAIVACAVVGPDAARRFLAEDRPSCPNALMLRHADALLRTDGALEVMGAAEETAAHGYGDLVF